MPKILSAAHALPPHLVPQEQIRALAPPLFEGRVPDLERLLSIFDRSRISRRPLMRPPEWYLGRRPPSEANRIYLEEGLPLLAKAVRECLESAALHPDRIDHLITVSSTGYATPTLDARLINEEGFRPTTSRAPLWGLGCAGGAAGLARAFDYCRAHPKAHVLVSALECCSLTFFGGDASKKNLVATALFGDGAAAVLVGGEETGGAGPRMRATRSHLFPDSYRIMGWDFHGEGMELVLSPRLPTLVRQELPGLVKDFLSERGMRMDDLRHHILHPGGAKVIDACRQALGLGEEELALTEEVLWEQGNLSSVSVLVVLEKWLAGGWRERPGPGLLAAFGPGFSAEMVLLEV